MMTRILGVLAAAAALVICLPAAVSRAAQPSSPSSQTAGPSAAMKPVANLRQLMIGMFYPESNVVFAAQGDLSAFKQSEDAATSPNPLTSIYPGWQAVQDAAISLEDAANLLLLPGRKCSNGRAVPFDRPDWAQFVEVLRRGAEATYKAAAAKSQDDMVSASYTLTKACDVCHAAYRDKYPKTGNSKVCMP